MNAVVLKRPASPSVASEGIEYLSWSRLSTYRDCPRRFFHRYVEHAPEEKVLAALPFGGSIHKAAERLAEARLAGKGAPSLRALVGEYDRAWREARGSGIPLQFAKGEDAGGLRALAKLMLAALVEFSKGERASVVAVEHESRFAVAGFPIVARMDLVESDGGNLVVSDLKTARSKYNDEKLRAALPQLVLYAHAALPMLAELGARRIQPRFIVVTKARRPVVQVLEPKPTQEDVKRLREMVTETHAAIKAGVFQRRESWQCRTCPFARRCLGNSSAMGATH